jgi:hypothetical protein
MSPARPVPAADARARRPGRRCAAGRDRLRATPTSCSGIARLHRRTAPQLSSAAAGLSGLSDPGAGDRQRYPRDGARGHSCRMTGGQAHPSAPRVELAAIPRPRPRSSRWRRPARRRFVDAKSGVSVRRRRRTARISRKITAASRRIGFSHTPPKSNRRSGAWCVRAPRCRSIAAFSRRSTDR